MKILFHYCIIWYTWKGQLLFELIILDWKIKLKRDNCCSSSKFYCGKSSSSSILSVSDRGVFGSWEFMLDGNWVYRWEFLLDGDPISSSILAVSDRGVFGSWEFMLDGK